MAYAPPEIKIVAGRLRRAYLEDLWRYRDLLYTLAWRDLKVRYKQTFIGVSWALLRPLLTMLIFVFVFGRVAGLDEGTQWPYPLLVLCGVIAWQLLSSIIAQAGDSLVGNERLISKVYFPRMLLPAATVGVSLLDFVISLLLLLGVFVVYGYWPGLSMLWLSVCLIPLLALGLGFGFLAAALNVRYRDVRYALPFALQLGLFISPVGFTTQIVPEEWMTLYICNPAVGILESFRWCILGPSYGTFPTLAFGISIGWSIIILIIGFHYFRKTERVFADVI